MKKSFIYLSLITAMGLNRLHAASFTVENINAVIPDGNLNGIQNSLNLSGLDPQITDVNVTLTLSGGFNGDFYAYLFHNNTISVLLNRPGLGSANSVGYPDAGFGPTTAANRFTFDDQAANDVHRYRSFNFSLNAGGQLTGAWQPDGRNIDPLSTGSAFDSASRSAMLSAFNGMNPNGQWTLFIADMSPGGEGTLVNWGVQLTTIPEPSLAGIYAIFVGAILLARHARNGVRYGRNRESVALDISQQ
jgi:subtilisin-like proprotein convertase family protein